MDCFPQWLTALGSYFTTDRVLGIYILYNALVQALPDPEQTDPWVYRFIYKFCHGLAGNINVVRKKVGGPVQ